MPRCFPSCCTKVARGKAPLFFCQAKVLPRGNQRGGKTNKIPAPLSVVSTRQIFTLESSGTVLKTADIEIFQMGGMVRGAPFGAISVGVSNFGNQVVKLQGFFPFGTSKTQILMVPHNYDLIFCFISYSYLMVL